MSPQSPASGAWAWASLGGGGGAKKQKQKKQIAPGIGQPIFFFGAPPPREAQAQAPVAGD